MKKYNAKCPCCGTVNKSLYLEETHGIMECEHCHMTVDVIEFNKKSPIILTIPVVNLTVR